MPDLDALTLIEKHRAKGVLIDTNLLVLLLVGRVNKRRIRQFDRTQSYTIDDFDQLERLIDWFGNKVIATPHVLAQVSDLTGGLYGKELDAIRQNFHSAVEQIEESYDLAKVLVAHPMFSRFGLTDVAIATVCSRGILVLTDDVRLQLALQHRGMDALNFNHIRPLAWEI